jgi:thiol:disulfide interchange protein DsbA
MKVHLSQHLSRPLHWLAPALVALLTACGSPQGTGNTDAASAPTPQAEATQPAAPTPLPTEEPTQAPPPAGVQESAAAQPVGGGEQLKLASAAPPDSGVQWRFQENQDFKVLTATQGMAGAPDKIEVVEAFWYGCPHCYQFDPLVGDWSGKLPGDVRFLRLPVMWNPTNQIHARLYYTAQALGKAEEIHSAVFREMHVNGKQLATEAEIEAFFGKFGVSAAEFQKTFRSFAVEGQLKRARDLTERYQIRSVPILIVNGKFTTEAPGVKSFDEMLAVANELIERERRR